MKIPTALALAAITLAVAVHAARAPISHTFRAPTPSTLDPNASVQDLLAAHPAAPGLEYSGADYISYLRAALRLRDDARLDWSYARLWPPGQPLLAATMLTLTGEAAYPKKMIILAALSWCAALTLLLLLGARAPKTLLPVAVYAASFWFVAPAFTAFNFGFGSVMTEATSTALFLSGAALVVYALQRRSLAIAAAGGACFGFAALLRPYFELMVLHPLLVLGVAALAFAALRARSLRPPRSALVGAGLVLLAAAAGGQGATLPWRVTRAAVFGSAQLSNFEQLTTWAFATDAELPGFHFSGNAACHVEPELCALVREHRAELRPSLVRKLVFMTFVSRPGPWLAFKLSFFDQLWFGRVWRELAPAEKLEGLLLLVVGCATLVYLAQRVVSGRAEPAELALLVLTLTFILANAGGFSLFQLEWRYSAALRAGAFFLPLFARIARRAV